MIFIAYVVDLIVAGKPDDVEELRKHLNNSFPTRIIGELIHYKGHLLSRYWERGMLKISQAARIGKSPDRFGVPSSKPLPACSSTPLRAKGLEKKGSREDTEKR